MGAASARVRVCACDACTAALLDQAVAAHQAAQAAFGASAAEAKAQRESMELELQQQQRMHAQEKDKRVTAEAAAAKLQLHVESIESNAQTLQQQVRALLHSTSACHPLPPPPPPLAAAACNTRQHARAAGCRAQRRPDCQRVQAGGCDAAGNGCVAARVRAQWVAGVCDGLLVVTAACCRCSWRSCSSAAARWRAQ